MTEAAEALRKSTVRPGAAARAGGHAARVLGVVALATGLPLALLLGMALQWLFPAGVVGYVLGIPLAIVAVALAAGLLLGGRKLQAAGATSRKRSDDAALVALARRRGGSLKVGDAAEELGVSTVEADRVLTALVKEETDTWDMDIDTADGSLVFRLRTRVADVEGLGPRVAPPEPGTSQEDVVPATLDLDVDLDPPLAAAQRGRPGR